MAIRIGCLEEEEEGRNRRKIPALPARKEKKVLISFFCKLHVTRNDLKMDNPICKKSTLFSAWDVCDSCYLSMQKQIVATIR